jgi:hypothetical protein
VTFLVLDDGPRGKLPLPPRLACSGDDPRMRGVRRHRSSAGFPSPRSFGSTRGGELTMRVNTIDGACDVGGESERSTDNRLLTLAVNLRGR